MAPETYDSFRYVEMELLQPAQFKVHKRNGQEAEVNLPAGTRVVMFCQLSRDVAGIIEGKVGP